MDEGKVFDVCWMEIFCDCWVRGSYDWLFWEVFVELLSWSLVVWVDIKVIFLLLFKGRFLFIVFKCIFKCFFSEFGWV